MIKKLILIFLIVSIFLNTTFAHAPQRIATPEGKEINFLDIKVDEEETAENAIELYNNHTKELPEIFKTYMSDGLARVHIRMDDKMVILASASINHGKIDNYDIIVKMDKKNEEIVKNADKLIFNTYEISYNAELMIDKVSLEKISKSENKKKSFFNEWGKGITYRGFGSNGIKTFFMNIIMVIYSIF